MKRTTIFLPEDLERMLQETARRTHRTQAEIVREALAQYLAADRRPWPRSIGMGKSADRSVTSDNVKEWVRGQWRREAERSEETAPLS
jgi:predicted transcriptional regulator